MNVFPLAHEWSVWYYEDRTTNYTKTPSEYRDHLRLVGNFNSVPSFWGMYEALPSITNLRQSAVYHYHWSGAIPLREDPVHSNGGGLIIRAPETSAVTIWETLCMGLVGGTIDVHLDRTLGILGVSIKKRNVLQRIYQVDCWLKNKKDLYKMEAFVEKHLHDQEILEIYFSDHKDHCAFNEKKLRKAGK